MARPRRPGRGSPRTTTRRAPNGEKVDGAQLLELAGQVRVGLGRAPELGRQARDALGAVRSRCHGARQLELAIQISPPGAWWLELRLGCRGRRAPPRAATRSTRGQQSPPRRDSPVLPSGWLRPLLTMEGFVAARRRPDSPAASHGRQNLFAPNGACAAADAGRRMSLWERKKEKSEPIQHNQWQMGKYLTKST
jgi:hypothetical protein